MSGAMMETACRHLSRRSEQNRGRHLDPSVESPSSRLRTEPAGDDVVGDRRSLLGIGMAAVFAACVVFSVSRLAITVITGKLTPWWLNAIGAIAVGGLFLWYRRRPDARTGWAANGTALIATVALVTPVAYGMTSSVWWLGLVGYAMVLLGRRKEAWAWGLAIPALVAATTLLEPVIQLPGAAGEPALEHGLARFAFVVVLVAIAAGFRRVADRRAEALYASNERYHMLFQQSPVGVVQCDSRRRIVDCNQHCEAILRLPREALAGRQVEDVLGAALLPAIDSALVGEATSYEGPWSRGGRYAERFVAARAVPLHTESGRIVGALCLIDDTTDRHRMERELERSRDDLEQRVQDRTEELRRSRAMIANILDSIPQFVFWKDVEGRYVGCNEVFAHAAGLARPDDIIGLTDLDLPWSGRAEAYRTDDREVVASLRPKRGIVERLTDADDRELWIVTTKVPLIDEGGAVIGVLGVFEDITERRRLEAQLRQAQKLEAVGRLAGGVAHDFNNLLQAMLSHIALIRKAPDRAAAELDDLEAQAQRGGALARQLLMFSRPEKGHRERLDLNQVVAESSALMRRVLRENVELAVQPTVGRLDVEADRNQLDQVLINLALNAADAMPTGGRLTLRTGGDREAAWFEVEDTGVGIAEPDRERIFEPFFTTKPAARGTGLGLSVVHGIIANHGGHIDVTSTVGVGSTFRVSLPRLAGVGASPTARPAPDRTLSTGNGEHLLIIEDEADTLEGLAGLLTMLGYTVTAVGTITDAQQLPADLPVDLLISDVMLPDGDGVTLALKLVTRWPSLKVILMSGYSEDQLMEDAAKLEAARFLQKPFAIATLAATIHELLTSGAPAP